MHKSLTISIFLVIVFIVTACTPAIPAIADPTPVIQTPTIQTPTIQTPVRPSLPAPAIPDVSSPITVDNVSHLTRLTSLGEGDIMNMQVSPDEKWIVLGTSNGVLVLDSTTMEKVLFLPTEMKSRNISFIESGTKLVAWDCLQGYIWSFPSGEEISRFDFQLVSEWAKSQPQFVCTSVPGKNWKYAFGSSNPYVMWGMDDYPSDYEPVTGLYDIQTGEMQYTLDYEVQYFSISSDEKLVALDTGDKLVIVQYQDGTVLHEIPESGIKSLLFMPDGKTLVSVYDNQIKFWNVADFNLIKSVAVYGIDSTSASPDGRILAVRTNNDDRFYSAEDGALLGGFSSGSYLFTGNSEGLILDPGQGQVQYYQLNADRSKFELVRSFPGEGIIPMEGGNTRSITPGVLSSDGSEFLVLSGNFSDNFYLLIYDMNSGSVVNQISVSTEANPLQHIENAIWVPSKNSFALMISTLTGGTYFSYVDISSESIVEVINRDYFAFFNSDMQFSHNGELLVSVQTSRLLSWDLANNGYWQINEYKGEWTGYGKHSKLDLSPDDKTIAITDSQTITHFFYTVDYSAGDEITNGKFIYLHEDYFATSDGNGVNIYFALPLAQVNSINIKNSDFDFNEAENTLAIFGEGLSVIKFTENFSNYETIFTDQSAYDWWASVKISPDGKYVAAERTSGVAIWDLQSGDLVYELDRGWRSPNFDFSPDSKMVAISKNTSAGNMISIFSLEEGKELFSTGGYFDESYNAPRIAFSPDGKYFAILTTYGYPQIWGIP